MVTFSPPAAAVVSATSLAATAVVSADAAAVVSAAFCPLQPAKRLPAITAAITVLHVFFIVSLLLGYTLGFSVLAVPYIIHRFP